MEVIIPYFKGKTLVEYNVARVDAELKEKAFPQHCFLPGYS